MARRDRKPDAGLNLVAEDEGEQQIRPAHLPQFGQRQQRRRHRRGRMDHGAHMGVAEIMDVGAGGIEERRAQRIDALGCGRRWSPACRRRIRRASAARSRPARCGSPPAPPRRNSSASVWPDAAPADGMSSHRVSTTKRARLCVTPDVCGIIILPKFGREHWLARAKAQQCVRSDRAGNFARYRASDRLRMEARSGRYNRSATSSGS